jgi:geranylgeranyl reductase family protein
MPDFDVICVGCGPAGNLAAYLLAQRGLSVLLLEREALPRRKVCGGGLTARALAALPYDITPIIHCRIDSARLAFDGQTAVQLDCNGIGAMVERSQLDAFMTERAVEAGARLLPCAVLLSIAQPSADRVMVTTTRGSFSARLLIGADGAASTVRSKLFPAWRPTHAFGIEANYTLSHGGPLPAPLQRQVLFDFGGMRSGYGWIFPKRDHFNVGIYRLAKSRVEPSLRQALAAFAASSPTLAGCTATQPVGHPIALSTDRQPLAQGRSILIGDAAGMAEAFFGEGIAFAFTSAAVAADWALGWLAHERGEAAHSYGTAIAPLAAELRWSHAVARARYRVPPRWMARALHKPAIRDATIALLRGKCSYKRSFWQMPLLAASALWQRKSISEPVLSTSHGVRP